MICINLLGTGKAKKGRNAGKLFVLPKLTWAGPHPAMVALFFLIAYGAGFYVVYHNAEQKHEQLQTDIAQANQNIAALSQVKQVYLQRQKEYDAVKRRFDVIDQLRAMQGSYPVALLDEISYAVNHTDGVWLHSLKDDGATVSLDGTALGPSVVANFMTNLRRSGYFKNVELKDTAQEDNPKIQTYSFTLVCEKAKA